MKKFWLALLAWGMLAIPALAQTYTKVAGYVEVGGSQVTTAGQNSITKVQRSYPNATVAVTINGSGTSATIYSDANGTVKSNPFTADSTGYWYFYAPSGTYDVTFSGAGISTPYTLTGFKVLNIADDGGLTTVSVNEIRYATAFSGANVAAKINAAIADLPSTGGIVYASFEGAQSLGAVTVDRPVRLIFGAGTFTQSAPITISTPVCTIEGLGPHATTFVTPSGGNSIALSGTLTVLQGHLTIRGINFNGAGAGSRALSIPSTAQITEGRILVQGNQFRSFTGSAIFLGTSNYHLTARENEFYACVTAIDVGEYADCTISDNNFYAAASGTSYYVKTQAQHTWILNNYFIPGGATGGADVWVYAASANSGYVWIDGNKFGNESENSARNKVYISAGATSYVPPRIDLTRNNFLGVASQTAIKVDAFTQGLRIAGNWFQGFTTLINDNAPAPVSASQFRYGENIFRDNQLYQTAGSNSPMRIFANGGYGWSVIEAPESAELLTPLVRLPKESVQGMVNRVTNTSASAAWVLNGVTGTDSQTDPAGGTTGVLITRGSTSSSLSAQLGVTLTNLKDVYGAAASGRNGVVHVTFWAKAGTLNYLTTTLYNATDAQTVTAHNFELGTGWKRYTFSYVGLDTTKTYRLAFYPGGTGTAPSGGTLTIAFPQISDYPETDFLPASGGYSTSTLSARFQGAVQFATTATVGSCKISSGAGTPEGAVTGNVCDLFLRTDGSTSTTLYVKTSGTGNTGWTAK